jgi:hypothetical protein
LSFGDGGTAAQALFLQNFPDAVADFADTYLVGVGDGTDTIAAMDGSDTYAMLEIDFTNADHTGSSNVLNGILIDDITADAEASEWALYIEDGWDAGILLQDTQLVLSGTGTDASLELRDTDTGAANFRLSRNSGASQIDFDVVTGFPVIWAVENSATIGQNLFEIESVLGAFNGSDTNNVFMIDVTNADHTGSSNVLNGILIDDITGDAQATESAIEIEDGWDYDIHFDATGVISVTDQSTIQIKNDSAAVAMLMDSANIATYRWQWTGSLADIDQGHTAYHRVAPTFAANDNASDIRSALFLDVTIPDGSAGIVSALTVDDTTGDANTEDTLFLLGDGYDYLINDFTNTALGTLTWTTANDKTGNAKSGTFKVWINGTLYHIQLYADS